MRLESDVQTRLYKVPDEPNSKPKIKAEYTTRLKPCTQYPGNGTSAWAILGTHRPRIRSWLRDHRLNQSICGRQRIASDDRTRVALVAATRSGYIVRLWLEPMLRKTQFRCNGSSA
jgi:hypothetical protein